MRVPPSTAVFAAVTCGLFGLAIRDTVAGKEYGARVVRAVDREPSQAPTLEDPADDDDLAEQLRARERADAETARETARAVGRLFGTRPATLGPFFDGTGLGSSDIDGLSGPISTLSRRFGIEITPIVEAGTLRTISIKPHTELACRELPTQLLSAWGAGHTAWEREIWLDRDHPYRAVLQSYDGCELWFEHYAPIASWLHRGTDSIVPWWAVGEPASKLFETLASQGITSINYMWTGLGVGAGPGATRIGVDVRSDKIAGVLVTVETDPATQEEIIRRVSELTGKEPDESLVWNTTPRIEIHQLAGKLTLSIRKRP